MPPLAVPDSLAEALRSSRPALFFVFACVALTALAVLGIEATHPWRYLAPDSFTYFDMARVFHDSGMLYSYSGLDHTTGIHPGYYFLLLPLYPLFGLALPAWSFAINGALIALALFLAYRAYGLTVALAMFFFVEVAQGAASTNNGMESALLFLMLSAIAYALSKWHALLPARNEALLVGLLLGGAVFARLDTIFFVFAVAVAIFVRALRTETWRTVVRPACWAALPFALVLVLIFFLDFHYGGTLLPLSGKLKSTFPHLSTEWKYSLSILKVFLVSIPVTGAYLAWQSWQKKLWGVLIPALFFSSVALFLYDDLFATGVGAWYAALPFFALALTAGLFVRDAAACIASILGRVGICAAVAVISLGVIGTHLLRGGNDWITPHQTAAAYLAARIQPGETAGEFKDGVFAFYAPFPVFNLTGLGNNQDYVDALYTGTLATYLASRRVSYIVGGSVASGVQVPGAIEALSCAQPLYDTGTVTIFSITSCAVNSLP